MRSDVIVFVLPKGKLAACIVSRNKDFPVERRVVHAAVETFVEAIRLRFAIGRFSANPHVYSSPFQDRPISVFRPIVTDNTSRLSANANKRIKLARLKTF